MHNLVEGPDELRIAIADDEPDNPTLLLECRCEVARLLGNPAPNRMLGDPSQEDLATFEVDKQAHRAAET
jgi:hypothetical protein